MLLDYEAFMILGVFTAARGR